MENVESTYSGNDVEEEVQEFWKRQEIYRKAKERRSGNRAYFFVDGPPYTTGYIHLGTAWNKILKDCILRYRRLQGLDVLDRAGYDMHGLPIEVKVEHRLGFRTKKEIEAFGIEPFIEECRQFALKNKDVMSDQFRRLGVWLDFEDAYQTLAPEYIEAAWWTLKRADEKRVLEQGYRVVNWCPRCETAIADAEVEYEDVSDPSIFVKFPLKGKEDEYLVIWTTTPWTLPANVAVAVNPQFVYARVAATKEGDEEILWMADDLVDQVLRKGRYSDFRILSKVLGSEMSGMEYLSPLAMRVPRQKKIPHRVVMADFVAMENTGIVHIAPGHGWEDYVLGLKEGLEVFCPVDESGHFTDEGGAYAGRDVHEVNGLVIADLGDHLLARGEIVHRYGHCWRCKTPIIYRATQQWFLRVSELRERMLEEIERVRWFPEWAGSARFHDWVKEARDWCISRQRYWGIPIPIWQCRSCHSYTVFGTLAELSEASGTEVRDPHRPYVDRITVPCRCGGTMERVQDIFDVWFDSAVASWATLRFPARREEFERLWPADFITEGQDQTRGWFYSQLGASIIAFDRSPYRSVLMHGFALDAEGRKMSKSLGNMVTPEEIISKFGADVLRLYVLSANAPWDDLKFNLEGVRTIHRTLNVLWNVYRFPLPYMILDRFSPPAMTEGVWDCMAMAKELPRLPEEDRWILSRTASLVREVEGYMESCELHRATRAIMHFILEDLSRWYIQLIRSRMWLEEDVPEKGQAYRTIYYVLRYLALLMGPITPYLAEKMYMNLKMAHDPESVHMLDWMRPDEAFLDPVLEEDMEVVRQFDDAVAAARQTARRKLRWPVAECIVSTGDPIVRRAIARLNRICTCRANSRRVILADSPWEGLGWRAIAQMKTIGPAFGKDAPRVKEAIERADGKVLREVLAGDGATEVHVGDTAVRIGPAHVAFDEVLPEGFTSANMKNATVYVDARLTPELEGEGYAREVIRRLQEMRRQLNLSVEDFILADVEIDDPRVSSLVNDGWREAIMREVRARSLKILPAGSDIMSLSSHELQQEWDVDDILMRTGISRSASPS
ncbi:MAG: isoleucine--tRNA ligase [Methanomicrobiales archaeon]|nr:isoleucine--tRNA ligase [Methanomicrobiales archaeon]